VSRKLKKWELLRVPGTTKRLLLKVSQRTKVPMTEIIERVVNLIYGRKSMSTMQALSFFLLYLDGKPTYTVAAKDKESAETGMRQQLLGQDIKEVKAVPFTEANEADVLRIGLCSVLTQMTQINALLQMLLEAKGGGVRFVGAPSQIPAPPQGGGRRR
jgi:hypothetical protein